MYCSLKAARGSKSTKAKADTRDNSAIPMAVKRKRDAERKPSVAEAEEGAKAKEKKAKNKGDDENK